MLRPPTLLPVKTYFLIRMSLEVAFNPVNM